MVYEDYREPEISLSTEIVGTSIFTISMVALILFVLTAFILRPSGGESIQGQLAPVSCSAQSGSFQVNTGRRSVPAQPEEMRQIRTLGQH